MLRVYEIKLIKLPKRYILMADSYDLKYAYKALFV